MVRKSDLTHRQGAIWDALAQGSPDLVEEALARPTRASTGKRAQPERDQVQRPLIVYLKSHLPRGAVVFTVPNLARSREHTWSLIRDGMLPGVPDICVITSLKKNISKLTNTLPVTGATRAVSASLIVPWVGFIECKRPSGGELSDAQREVQAQLRAHNIPVLAECRSIPEAVAWLLEQGVTMR